jgi:hypothetical protein
MQMMAIATNISKSTPQLTAMPMMDPVDRPLRFSWAAAEGFCGNVMATSYLVNKVLFSPTTRPLPGRWVQPARSAVRTTKISIAAMEETW